IPRDTFASLSRGAGGLWWRPRSETTRCRSCGGPSFVLGMVSDNAPYGAALHPEKPKALRRMRSFPRASELVAMEREADAQVVILALDAWKAQQYARSSPCRSTTSVQWVAWYATAPVGCGSTGASFHACSKP